MDPRSNIQRIMGKLGFDERQTRHLETGVYNFAIEYAKSKNIPQTWHCEIFKEIYMGKARSVYANLDPTSYINNTSLRPRLENGEIKIHEIASLPPVTLYPDHWLEITSEERIHMEKAYEVTRVAMTNQVICGKCKNKEITYYEQQTRSGDEGTTVFYMCLVCNNKWRHS